MKVVHEGGPCYVYTPQNSMVYPYALLNSN